MDKKKIHYLIYKNEIFIIVEYINTFENNIILRVFFLINY